MFPFTQCYLMIQIYIIYKPLTMQVQKYHRFEYITLVERYLYRLNYRFLPFLCENVIVFFLKLFLLSFLLI